jgi:hypothetical protein
VAPASADPSNGTTTTKVNADTASVDQLQAAFAAAGITNADRWAALACIVPALAPYRGDNS